MRRGTLFLRYQVGDVVSLTHEPCPHCGRTSPRITSQPMRAGDIVKIKGMLVNLQVLKDRLDHFPALDEYQIVVQPVDAADAFSMDELVIRIAVASGEQGDVGSGVAEETIRLVQVRPRIETVARDDIYDPLVAAKPRRVLDLRSPRN
jgi:phenylacetate-CoA ligase